MESKQLKLNPKPDLGKVYEMMVWIEQRDERGTTTQLKQEFGDYFLLFERYCAGGDKPYATELRGNFWKLTQNGLRHLYDLQKLFTEQKNNSEQSNSNLMIAGLTGVLALGVLADIGLKVGMFSNNARNVFWLTLALMLIVSFVVTAKNYLTNVKFKHIY